MVAPRLKDERKLPDVATDQPPPLAPVTRVPRALRRRWFPLRRTAGVLPGYPLALGFTLFYLSILVLVPLGALVFKASGLSAAAFWSAVSGPRAVAAYRVSVSSSFL